MRCSAARLTTTRDYSDKRECVVDRIVCAKTALSLCLRVENLDGDVLQDRVGDVVRMIRRFV